ncbi:hypothetical protein HZA44_03455 [Candidatus Peregrinibacteria bacterium]|nr:hypothetical protein [Candidatus Peregrinibacteria bacterium]
MSTTLILFITIHLVALTYFFEHLRRVYIRSREYELKEDRFSLPFGFIRLRHVIALYIFCYLLWVTGSIILYRYFIDPSSIPSEAPTRLFNLEI